MNDIDPTAERELRDAARVLYDEVTLGVTSSQIDDAFAEVMAASATGADTIERPISLDSVRDRRPRTGFILAAAAAVAALVGAAIVFVGDDDPGDIITDTPPITGPDTVPDTVPVPEDEDPSVVDTTVPDTTPGSTVAPETTTPGTTTPGTVEAVRLPVSATEPPPLIEPDPGISVAGSVPLEVGPLGSVQISIGENAIGVYQHESDPDGNVVTRSLSLVPYEQGADVDADIRRIEPDVDLGFHVLGPDDVAYGFGGMVPFEDGDTMPTPMQFHAVSLGDEPTVVTTELLDTNTWLELPVGPIGLGDDGVVGRDRRANETLVGYVDADGAPTSWTGPVNGEVTTTRDGDLVRVERDGTAWELPITTAPGHVGTFVGPSPAAPTSRGRTVYHERIGDAVEPGQDFSESDLPVIAVLDADGTGTWYRLPDDWFVGASEVWGTALLRIDREAGVIEVALLDDALPAVDTAASGEEQAGDTGAAGIAVPLDPAATLPVQPFATVAYGAGDREIELLNGEFPPPVAWFVGGALVLEDAPGSGLTGDAVIVQTGSDDAFGSPADRIQPVTIDVTEPGGLPFTVRSIDGGGIVVATTHDESPGVRIRRYAMNVPGVLTGFGDGYDQDALGDSELRVTSEGVTWGGEVIFAADASDPATRPLVTSDPEFGTYSTHTVARPDPDGGAPLEWRLDAEIDAEFPPVSETPLVEPFGDGALFVVWASSDVGARPVAVVLEADGTGTAYDLDGWSVEDVNADFGVLLSRSTPDGLDLATFTPPA